MANTTRYEIIDDSHGEGGFGKIQKRKDKILERFVAVKSLKLLDDAEARERFIKEAKTLARMSHPNIPAIFDVEFLDKEMDIYFEFVEGESLRDYVTERRIPSIDQVRRWFSQIGSALTHSHGLGIVHRDIKPENIIISTDGTTGTLVDFGVALTLDDAKRLTASGFPVLVSAGLLKPLGHPLPSGTKFFATATLEKLRGDINWLSRATDAIARHWQTKNSRKKTNGNSVTPHLQPVEAA